MLPLGIFASLTISKRFFFALHKLFALDPVTVKEKIDCFHFHEFCTCVYVGKYEVPLLSPNSDRHQILLAIFMLFFNQRGYDHPS